MKRKLASIQEIVDIQPIPGADKIEVASVLGWKVVVQKGMYNIGDEIVYCEVDSFLPVRPQYEFLRKSSFRKHANGSEGFRVKTAKLRGQISQGIILPFGDMSSDLCLGDDVTDFLGIIKWEDIVPTCLAGDVVGKFPSFMHKTDEIRVQSVPEIISEFKGKEFYISTKMDGSSATYFKFKDEFGVCSREWQLKESDKNTLWSVAKKYDIMDKLPEGFAIQGELCGPGIQKNKLCLNEHKVFVFNLFDINNDKYLSVHEMQNFCKENGLDIVPIEKFGTFDFSVEQLLEMAKGLYSGTQNKKEGIVIRTINEEYSNVLSGRSSFKVLNNDALLGEE